jgi:hypothetical protein
VGYESDISTELLCISCAFCGKALRRPDSVERGYGPDCDENFMMGMGAGGVVDQMASTFDEAEAEAAIASAPDIEPTQWVEPTRIARKGQELDPGDGCAEPHEHDSDCGFGHAAARVKAKGGEVLESRPLRPGSLRHYWRSKGDAWRTSIEARQAMVSYGIWYASRAVTFGFDGDQVMNEKADPRFLVVAAVQRFARAVGLFRAADAMANFYAARVVKVVKAKLKEQDSAERDAIIFETGVPPQHRPYRDPIGPGMLRVHAPFSDQFNRLVRENKRVFPAFEKDGYYFWRYFHESNLREVVNICQAVFGDRMALTRPMQTSEVRAARSRLVRVIDSWTGEVRLFPKAIADRLVNAQPQGGPKSRLRYQVL